jgi:hypothetical protein
VQALTKDRSGGDRGHVDGGIRARDTSYSVVPCVDVSLGLMGEDVGRQVAGTEIDHEVMNRKTRTRRSYCF